MGLTERRTQQDRQRDSDVGENKSVGVWLALISTGDGSRLSKVASSLGMSSRETSSYMSDKESNAVLIAFVSASDGIAAAFLK